MAIFCLISLIWSTSVVVIRAYWRKDVHALNIGWMAVSAAGFAHFMGWVQ